MIKKTISQDTLKSPVIALSPLRDLMKMWGVTCDRQGLHLGGWGEKWGAWGGQGNNPSCCSEGSFSSYSCCNHFLFSFSRDLEIGQLSDNYKLTVTLDDGCYNLKDTNTTYDEINTETFTIKERDPSSAKVHIQGQVMMKKEGHTAEQEDSGHTRWDTRVQASSEMWCDEQFFHLKSQLTAWHCNEECFDKTWTKKIERFYV